MRTIRHYVDLRARETPHAPYLIAPETGATLDYATTRYPDDSESWFLLGEANEHLGPYAGRSDEQVLDAFDRAIALDSAYGPSYIHPIEASASEGAEAMRRYLRPYLALAGGDVRADGERLVRTVLDSVPTGADPLVLFRGVSDLGLTSAYFALARLPDSAEVSVSLARLIAERPLSVPPLDTPLGARRSLARALMSRGHLRAGAELLAGQEPNLLFADAALLGAVPAESAAARFRDGLSGPVSALLVAAFPWWAARRDTTSLRKAESHADSLARSEPASATLPRAPMWLPPPPPTWHSPAATPPARFASSSAWRATAVPRATSTG